jgi:YihY family inner membrane protein
MSVIFFHRVAIRRRHFVVSAVLPYLFILFLSVGFLVVTLVSGALQAMSVREIQVLGELRSLGRVSAFLFYLIGVAGEILILTAFYLVMPAGRLSLRHALIGGITAGLLWELSRHALVWYYSTISQIGVVYGSLTTAIAVLLSMEIAALLLLFGAQVIDCSRLGTSCLAFTQQRRSGSGSAIMTSRLRFRSWKAGAPPQMRLPPFMLCRSMITAPYRRST